MIFFVLGMSSKKYYSDKVLSQREHRAQKRKQIDCLPSFISSDSDDSDSDMTECPNSFQTVGLMDSSVLNNNDLLDYTADEHDNINEDSIDQDSSSLLFIGSSSTVCAATMFIMQFATNANLDKIHTIKLLKLIKSLLPQPNILPISHKNVLKVFGRTSTFTTKYLCEKCGNDAIVFEDGIKRCSSSICSHSHQNLANSRLTEIVTMDIRSGIHSIVRQNIELLLANKNLCPIGDIINFNYYLNHSEANKVSEKSKSHVFFVCLTSSKTTLE